VWTISLILLASLVSLTVGWLYEDPFYVLVSVWALIAIGVANKSNMDIVYMAWTAAALLFVYALCLLWSSKLRWNRALVEG
jgi:hypothetical protein